MILFCCASELGPPEDLSAIEVILYYYYYSVGRKGAPSYLDTWWWNSDVRKAEDENRYRFLGSGSGRRPWMTGWHTQLRSVQLEGQSDTGWQRKEFE